MSQYVAWLMNTLLFVLCCFLLADTANAVFASLLTPAPAEVGGELAAPIAPGRSWSERQQIVARNLFNASILAPPTPVVEEQPEDLEATRLPLNLVGTAAAADPAGSWAAIEDLEARKTKIVRVGDELRPNVPVLRIERRRIVLSEKGVARELALNEDDEGSKLPSPGRAPARTPARRPNRRTARAPSPPPPPPEVPRADVEAALRNPAAIFQQARIQPQLDEAGEMQGVQISDIKPGSLFEEIGIESGDVITELNGIRIDSPEQSARFLTEFTRATEFNVVVERESGSTILTFTVPE